MNKIILTLCLLILGFSVWGIVNAQSPPIVEVVMSTDVAAQDDVISADVYVRSDDDMVGADIGISVDSCLRIEGRENGSYLPTTAEEGGFIPFETLTETETRLSATVLGQNMVADPSQYFFRVPLRVMCASGQATVSVTFAQLVNPDLDDYKLAENEVVVINGMVTLTEGQPVESTAQVFPTPTELGVPTSEPSSTTVTAIPSPTPIEPPPLDDDDDLNMVVLCIGGILLIALLVLIILVILFLRRRRSEE